LPNFRHRLSRAQRVIYDRSDAVGAIPLRVSPRLTRAVALLPVALSGDYADDAERRRKVAKVAQVICDETCQAMRVDAPSVVVKGVRPTQDRAEYHGLYVSEGHSHEITLWMYTAKRKQVVAPRTLLRTLVHEVVHHLDFTKLGLEESFHTDGFFKRESDLVRQIERAAAKAARAAAPPVPGRVAAVLALKSRRADETG
jgi:hypothetical protein